MAYTVKSGDTLWVIAQRLLGSGSRWRELLGPSGLAANFDPRRLQIGTVIKTAAEAKKKPVAKAPAPAKAAAPKPAVPSPGPVPVDPGLAARQWEAALALQKQLAEEQAQLQRESQADVRRQSEAQLSANPADFVAYELYRRSLEEEGFTPERASRSNVDIQNLFNVALGLEGSSQLPEGMVEVPENVAGGIFGLGGDPSTSTLGKGQFGVNLPTTGSISRAELQSYSPTDLGILESFLRGGVKTEGGFQGINPQDFFTELEEGLIPTLTPTRTQYRL
ncbi:hypothetical protein LCGC14_1135230 [marine sediment metagenome]|uniref:LysM domain-containing protein n=1 Tax=marine sediment metagenome TaxID=412755 RepID=A0A0F9PI44_9ZZZZ